MHTRIATNGEQGGRLLMLWCPGCEDVHQVSIDPPDGWTWDGNRDRPTIAPSILVSSVQWEEGHTFHRPNHRVAARERTTCHSFVRDGHWEFLPDSTHVLAGQRVPVLPFPSHLADGEL